MTQFTSAELVAMGRHLPTPFDFDIVTEQGAVKLTIDSLLRVVPGKRIVALGSWNDRIVVIKMFINSNRWKRSVHADITGINRLRRAHIPTPELLLQTTSTDEKAGVLIIEYLSQGVSLASMFDEARGEESKAEIVEIGVKAIADCHRAGLLQNDIHLDNFMLSGGVLYVLDGADIQGEDGSSELDVGKRLDNLAMFLAQFPASQDKRYTELVDLYSKQFPNFIVGNVGEFSGKIVSARRKRLDTYERKLTRSTTANRCERGIDHFYIYDRDLHSSDLERFLTNPDSFIEGQKLLKDGNSSTVALIEINGRDYVVKRYNIKSFWHAISRMLRPSRAHHSWRNASVLRMLGVATARPFLYLEERSLWIFRKRAYFLCEYLQGPDLGAALEGGELDANKEQLVAQFGELFRILADYQISHGDMKATNFLLKDDKIYVLDLDAMVRITSIPKFKEKFDRDMRRFRKNWVGTSMEPYVETLLARVAKY